MNYQTGIEPISALKAHTEKLIRKIHENKQPIIITQNGKAKAVLQDIESYQRQRDALLMLKLILQGEQDYQDNHVITHKEADKLFTKKS